MDTKEFIRNYGHILGMINTSWTAAIRKAAKAGLIDLVAAVSMPRTVAELSRVLVEDWDGENPGHDVDVPVEDRIVTMVNDAVHFKEVWEAAGLMEKEPATAPETDTADADTDEDDDDSDVGSDAALSNVLRAVSGSDTDGPTPDAVIADKVADPQNTGYPMTHGEGGFAKDNRPSRSDRDFPSAG